MILSRRAALNGQQLDELDERIVIRSINPGVPNETLGETQRMGGAGSRLTGQHWNSLDVIVVYAIDVPKTDLETRRNIFDKVNAWAKAGGWLTINYMPGKRAYIDKTLLPASGDLWQWTNEVTLTFRAYNVPFWQDEEAQKAVKQLSNGTMNVHVNGPERTVLNASLKNVSGQSIKDISIGCGKHTLKFSGINRGASATLVISHGTDGLLRANVGSTSVYSKITGADDLYADPGDRTVSITATRALEVTVESYGRYV